MLYRGILDELFGADCGAQPTVVTFSVVDGGQILGDGDGIVGADFTA